MQMCVIVKTRCLYSFTINSRPRIKKLTKKLTILGTLTKKNSLRNLARFDSGRFELEILEIFTTLKLLFELEFVSSTAEFFP